MLKESRLSRLFLFNEYKFLSKLKDKNLYA
jgi:hypothetical protein